MWNGNKRLQTLVADVAPDTITIRSLDWVRPTAALWLLWIGRNVVLCWWCGELHAAHQAHFHAYLALACRTATGLTSSSRWWRCAACRLAGQACTSTAS